MWGGGQHIKDFFLSFILRSADFDYFPPALCSHIFNIVMLELIGKFLLFQTPKTYFFIYLAVKKDLKLRKISCIFGEFGAERI